MLEGHSLQVVAESKRAKVKSSDQRYEGVQLGCTSQTWKPMPEQKVKVAASSPELPCAIAIIRPQRVQSAQCENMTRKGRRSKLRSACTYASRNTKMKSCCRNVFGKGHGECLSTRFDWRCIKEGMCSR